MDEDDLAFLKSQPLWTGCRNTPYFIRAGINIDKCLLYITNLRTSWVCKLNRDQILMYKEKFNSSIQTQNFQGVLDLLELALKFDPSAEYNFQLHPNELLYGYSNVIKIYTLAWVFSCKEIEDHIHFKILTHDIVNPLLLTIQSLENRCENYKAAYTSLELDYIRRLNDKEKSQYKPRDKDEDLKIYIADDQIDEEKVCQIHFGEAANFFVRYYAINKVNKGLQQMKKRQPVPQHVVQNLNKKEQIWQSYENTLNDLVQGKAQQVAPESEKKDNKQQQQSKNTKKKVGFL